MFDVTVLGPARPPALGLAGAACARCSACSAGAAARARVGALLSTRRRLSARVVRVRSCDFRATADCESASVQG